MTRKRCRRRVIVPMLPRGLRPKLTRETIRELSIVHHVNLDAIARGEGNEDLLWQVIGGALTWVRIAQGLGIGEPETTDQLQMLDNVVERYGRTGRVAFSGPDYQRAKHAVFVMDQLAELVDVATAVEAAEWSERRVNKMADEFSHQHHANERALS